LYVPPPEKEDAAMRKPTLAIAALLTCATLPALAAQSGQEQQQPPPAAQPAPPKADDTPRAVKAPAAVDNGATRASRFSFNRVDDGFLRLDNQTGQIAYCSPHAVGWACQAVPEDRAALETEISRLKDEIAGLKAQVALLHEPPPRRPPAELTPPPPGPPPPMADKDQDRANQDSAKLREDLERARLAFENAWRRLVEMIVNLQKDMKRKS
jgi:nucleotide-binding universal stress UspA family protein